PEPPLADVDADPPADVHLHAVAREGGEGVRAVPPEDTLQLRAIVLEAEVTVPVPVALPSRHLATHPDGVLRRPAQHLVGALHDPRDREDAAGLEVLRSRGGDHPGRYVTGRGSGVDRET